MTSSARRAAKVAYATSSSGGQSRTTTSKASRRARKVSSATGERSREEIFDDEPHGRNRRVPTPSRGTPTMHSASELVPSSTSPKPGAPSGMPSTSAVAPRASGSTSTSSTSEPFCARARHAFTETIVFPSPRSWDVVATTTPHFQPSCTRLAWWTSMADATKRKLSAAADRGAERIGMSCSRSPDAKTGTVASTRLWKTASGSCRSENVRLRSARP
jgi:hypothetical protein